MKKKVMVAMSGGVDSSVTAALLLEQGWEVGGATIRTWAPNDCENLNTRACCGLTGVEDARDVAARLGIPYWVFNFEKSFKSSVIDYFASEYKKGRTPNPCIACNEHVKFRQFLVRAKQMGYEYIATGHYAKVAFDEEKQKHYITEGVDPTKDQSYVLFPLDSDVLSRVLLPLGDYTKDQIRDKARELGLQSVMDKPDSQEICFIPSNDYGAFLEREYGEDRKMRHEFKSQEGIVRTRDGKVIGKHQGYYHFTRGQRRGLRIPYKEKLYVVDVDAEKNEVIVGSKEEVLNHHFIIDQMNWFLKPNTTEPFSAFVKIRSQHTKAKAMVTVLDDKRVDVVFDQPQDAITSGQGAVIYQGNQVLGGGWIGNVCDLQTEESING